MEFQSIDVYKKSVKYFGIFYILMILGAIPTILGVSQDPDAFSKYSFYVLYNVTFQGNDIYFTAGMIYQSVLMVLFTMFIRIKWTIVREAPEHEDKHPYSKKSRIIRRIFSFAVSLSLLGIILGLTLYFYIYFKDNKSVKVAYSEMDARDVGVGIMFFFLTYLTEPIIYRLVSLEVHDKLSKDESALYWKKIIHRVLVLYIFTVVTAFTMTKQYCYLTNVILVYLLSDFFLRGLFGMFLPWLDPIYRKKQVRLSEEYSDIIFKFYVSVVYTNLMPTISIVALLSLIWNRLFLNIRLKHEEVPIESGVKLTKHVWASILMCVLMSVFFTNFATTFLYANSRAIIQPFCFP